MRSLPIGLVFTCAAAVALLAPAAAPAATFYVDDSSPGTPTPCTNPPPANACQTINQALIQARGVSGPDLIMVAAGTYNESVDFDDDDDAGNILDGAGTSTSGTEIVHPPGEGSSVQRNNITIRDLAFLGSDHVTLFIGKPTLPGVSGTVVENVLVLNNETNPHPGISVLGSDETTLAEVTVDGDSDWDGPGAYGVKLDQSQNARLTDSDLLSNAGGVFSRLSSLRITRSVVRAGTDSTDPGIEVLSEFGVGASLTLDSSLVILGNPGLSVTDTGGSTPTANAVVWNSTIDAGPPKGSTGTAIEAVADTASVDDVGVTFNSSIAVGAISFIGAGTGVIFCRYSDVPDTVQPAPRRIACSTDPGNADGNSTTPANQLFEPGTLFFPSWHLLPDSPAIDTGSTDPLAPGQSTTDFEGNPRVVDGDCDGVARRDKGAYERPIPPCPPPPPPPPPSPPAGTADDGDTAGRPTCAGRAATMVGTSAPDLLVGTPGPDVIVAGAGNDRVLGLGGKDFLCGESGKDKLIGGGGRDVLAGGKGPDVLKGKKGKDKLIGGKGRDKLIGGGGKDICKGGKGKDRAKGCERTRKI